MDFNINPEPIEELKKSVSSAYNISVKCEPPITIDVEIALTNLEDALEQRQKELLQHLGVPQEKIAELLMKDSTSKPDLQKLKKTSTDLVNTRAALELLNHEVDTSEEIADILEILGEAIRVITK